MNTSDTHSKQYGILKSTLYYQQLPIQRKNAIVEIIEEQGDFYQIELEDGFRVNAPKQIIEVIVSLKQQVN